MLSSLCRPLVRASVALSLVLAAPPAFANTWTNYIDPSMINDIVHRDGVLYMATFGGLLVYDIDRGQFEQFDNDEGFLSNALTCLTFQGDDLYIGSNDFGVAKVRFANGRPNLVRSLNAQIDRLASNTINAIAPWGEDLVYGANPGAGTIRNDFASARYYERDGLPDDDVRDVLADGDYAWLATNAGVAVLDRLGFIRRPTGAPTVANVLATDGTAIFVGTNDGVRRMNRSDSTWTDIGPDTRAIFGLLWDGTDLWAGNARDFFRYTGTGANWTTLSTFPIITNYGFGGGGFNNQIKAIAKADDGNLYLGSAHPTEVRGANLIRFDGTNATNLVPNAPGGSDIRRLAIDTDGSLWAMFFNFYAGKLTPSGSWFNYNSTIAGAQLPSSRFTNLALLADSQGYKWFCSLPSPTLDQLDDGTDTSYGNDVWTRHGIDSGGGDGLGTLALQRGLEDPEGNRWFLSNGGGIQILSADGTQWFEMTPIKDPRMLSGDVTAVAFGPGSVWVGHRDLGVQRWVTGGYDWTNLSNAANDQWTTQVPATLLDGRIFTFALRSDNTLWIGTNNGLYRYPSTNVNRVVDEFPVFVGIGAGILDGFVRDLALDHDEDLWVATSKGINKIARDDDGDVETYTSASEYVISLAQLRYPLSIISPLSNADCWSLAIHPTRNILYIGTIAGVTVLDYTPPAPVATDLSRVYLYPNPVYRSRGQNEVMIQNITGPVAIEVYTLEGTLVHRQTVDADGQVAWDLTTRSGFVAGSGNYLVRVVGPEGAVTRTIAVLR